MQMSWAFYADRNPYLSADVLWFKITLILSLQYSCYKKAIKPQNYDQTAREMNFTKST